MQATSLNILTSLLKPPSPYAEDSIHSFDRYERVKSLLSFLQVPACANILLNVCRAMGRDMEREAGGGCGGGGGGGREQGACL